MNFQQKLFTLFVLGLCCTMYGCVPHSLGQMGVHGEKYASAKTISTGKAVYVALSEPLPPSLSDTPSFIIAQFCKTLAPIASSVSVGENAVSAGAALANAKESNSDYLILLRLFEWEKGSMLKLGPRVLVDASIFDSVTGDMLTQHKIEAKCYAMSMGLEVSPRECVRPQVEEWVKQVFGVTINATPYSDPTTFPQTIYKSK